MTDKQMEEKKKEFYKGFVDPEYYNIDDELPNSEYGEWLRDPDDVWQWISKLVEEVEREQLNQIEELSEEMEGNFNNTMVASGFQTALDECYYRLSGGKFLVEVLEEKSKKTTN